MYTQNHQLSEFSVLIFIMMPSSISDCSKMVFPSIFRCSTILSSITMIFKLDISNTFLIIRRFSESFICESTLSVFSFRQLLMSEGYRRSPCEGPILARLRWLNFVFSNTDGGSAKSTNGKKRIFTTIMPLMSIPLAL